MAGSTAALLSLGPELMLLCGLISAATFGYLVEKDLMLLPKVFLFLHSFSYSLLDGHLGDLWQFSPSTGQWTFKSGSPTIDTTGTYTYDATAAPGSRSAMAYWSDDEFLWMFGGEGYTNNSGPSGLTNDLWKYDFQNPRWTWVSGSYELGQPGSYNNQADDHSNSDHSTFG